MHKSWCLERAASFHDQIWRRVFHSLFLPKQFSYPIPSAEPETSGYCCLFANSFKNPGALGIEWWKSALLPCLGCVCMGLSQFRINLLDIVQSVNPVFRCALSVARKQLVLCIHHSSNVGSLRSTRETNSEEGQDANEYLRPLSPCLISSLFTRWSWRRSAKETIKWGQIGILANHGTRKHKESNTTYNLMREFTIKITMQILSATMEQSSWSYIEVRFDQILTLAKEYGRFGAVSWVLMVFFDYIISSPNFWFVFYFPFRSSYPINHSL